MDTVHPAARGASHDAVQDHHLFERLVEGDADAFDALLARYWAVLVRYAAGMVGGWDDAADIVQEAFIRVWEWRERWDAGGSVQALLYRIVRNTALDEQKRVEVRARADVRDEVPRPARSPTPVEHVVAWELEAAIDRAVRELSPRRREVFVLARYQGLSNPEIADVMGIAAQTVANQLCSAVAELRSKLQIYLDPQAPGTTG